MIELVQMGGIVTISETPQKMLLNNETTPRVLSLFSSGSYETFRFIGEFWA